MSDTERKRESIVFFRWSVRLWHQFCAPPTVAFFTAIVLGFSIKSVWLNFLRGWTYKLTKHFVVTEQKSTLPSVLDDNTSFHALIC